MPVAEAFGMGRVSRKLWALVLAGGDGTRLQEWTRALTGVPIPKQYCCVAGNQSMLEATLARLAPLVPPERTVVVVNRNHIPVAERQLGALPSSSMLVQPRNRDTGPGMIFSLLQLERRGVRGTVAVFPSDHYVRDARAFLAHVARARALVECFPEKVVLLGMTPDRADPALGYIERGAPADAPGMGAAFHVAAFVEKPGPELAKRIARAGGLWNSFVMVFRLATMLSLLRERRPAEFEALRGLDERAYESLAPWNFSRDFLAEIPSALLVLPVADVGWSDWGTPQAIERTLREVKRARLRAASREPALPASGAAR